MPVRTKIKKCKCYTADLHVNVMNVQHEFNVNPSRFTAKQLLWKKLFISISNTIYNVIGGIVYLFTTKSYSMVSVKAPGKDC